MSKAQKLSDTLQSFDLGNGRQGLLYSLPELERTGVGPVSKLPVSIRLVLESVLEPVFDRDSFGHRPGRSALDAVALVRRRSWKCDRVVEFDIKGLFDNIDHELLLRAVRNQRLSSALDATKVQAAGSRKYSRRLRAWPSCGTRTESVCALGRGIRL